MDYRTDFRNSAHETINELKVGDYTITHVSSRKYDTYDGKMVESSISKVVPVVLDGSKHYIERNNKFEKSDIIVVISGISLGDMEGILGEGDIISSSSESFKINAVESDQYGSCYSFGACKLV